MTANDPKRTFTNRYDFSNKTDALIYCYIEDAMASELILESTLTCPKCGHKKTENMPVNACQFYYECESCKSLLKPKIR